MNNTATRMIRSEEITIDMRICTILAGGKKPGEVYFDRHCAGYGTDCYYSG